MKVKYEGNSYTVAPFCWTVDGNAVIVTKNTTDGIVSIGLLNYRNNEAAHDAAWKLANRQPTSEGLMKLYRCWNGTLETVTFIEEGLSDPTCTITTYLCRDENGRKFRCGKEMYTATVREAYTRYLGDCREAVPGLLKQRDELDASIKHCRNEVERMDILIAELA